MLNSLTDLILPDGSVLELDEIYLEGNPIVLKVHARLPTLASCLLYGHPSRYEHSGYERIMADLAITGKRLQLKLAVRRLFWYNPD